MLEFRPGVGGDVGHYENFAALDQVLGSVRYTFSSEDPALRRLLVLHGRHPGLPPDRDRPLSCPESEEESDGTRTRWGISPNTRYTIRFRVVVEDHTRDLQYMIQEGQICQFE